MYALLVSRPKDYGRHIENIRLCRNKSDYGCLDFYPVMNSPLSHRYVLMGASLQFTNVGASCAQYFGYFLLRVPLEPKLQYLGLAVG